VETNNVFLKVLLCSTSLTSFPFILFCCLVLMFNVCVILYCIREALMLVIIFFHRFLTPPFFLSSHPLPPPSRARGYFHRAFSSPNIYSHSSRHILILILIASHAFAFTTTYIAGLTHACFFTMNQTIIITLSLQYTHFLLVRFFFLFLLFLLF